MVGDNCCICLSRLVADSVVTTACGHHFHCECFDKLKEIRDNGDAREAALYSIFPMHYRRHVQCPLCRTFLAVDVPGWGNDRFTYRW